MDSYKKTRDLYEPLSQRLISNIPLHLKLNIPTFKSIMYDQLKEDFDGRG